MNLESIRTNYYIGNFQTVIRLVDDIGSSNNAGKDNQYEEQAKFFSYRSLLELERFESIIDEIDTENGVNNDLSKALVYYAEFMKAKKTAAPINVDIEKDPFFVKLKVLYNFHKNSSDKNVFEMISLLLAQLYLQAGSQHLENAYSLLSNIPFQLESIYLRIVILLKIGQYSLAEQLLLELKKIDNFDILTQLSTVVINLKLKKNLNELLQTCSFLSQNYKVSSMLLNLQTTACLIMKRFEEAAKYTNSCLEINQADPEASVNWYVICCRLDKGKEIIERAKKQAIQNNPNFATFIDECESFFTPVN